MSRSAPRLRQTQNWTPIPRLTGSKLHAETHIRIGPQVGDLLAPTRIPARSPRVAQRNTMAMPGISRFVAASLIGCQTHAIDEMLNAGWIAPMPREPSEVEEARTCRRVDPDSVAAFRRTWAYAELYRETLGLMPGDRRSGPLLKDLGVRLRVLEVGAKGYTVYLIERKSARSILGLQYDPDDPKSGSALAFDTLVIEALMERGTFKRSGQTGRLALVSMSGDIGLHIDVHRDQEDVVFELIRYSAKSVPPDVQVEFARKVSKGKIEIDVDGARLTAKLHMSLPGLAEPARWPELVDRVVSGTELFRTAFPIRRYHHRGRSITR